MKHLLSILWAFVLTSTIHSQAIYETIESSKLGASRELKIQLPRDYYTNTYKKYPLFIVLDGDYLFEVVSGNVDYYTYWEDMPGAIVVGINQFDKRDNDCMYSAQNSLPIEDGAQFFEFIGMELIPYIENKYRTTNFKVAVGHGETANFINYFLLKPMPIFQGYISISPELAPNMTDYITDVLSKAATPLFYYLAYTNKDSEPTKKAIEHLNTNVSGLNNKNVFYKFDNFISSSHYAVSTNAIPNAIDYIFKIYQPISKEEYKETILNLETSPVAYLKEKYKNIHELYGIKKQISINDFKAIEAAIEKNKKFPDFEELSKMIRSEYPKTLLEHYYLARFYEESGEPKKAMRTYQSGSVFEELGGITKNLMLEKANAIRTDFSF